ncbi:hypothetical protein L083_7750 [Actinoplanes sp. N902-109]|nr:hypothetical protein L083_7750 [Actinoplanes sp. N902-109]
MPLPPPPPPVGSGGAGAKRRRWLVAVVAAWVVVLVVAVVWAVRKDPPTVPEQRPIAESLPLVEQVTGAVVAAADAPDRTVEIGALTFDQHCSITPVRGGVEAIRDVVVRVRDDQIPGALESVAAALPGQYRAEVQHNAGNTRFALHADAGDFVGIDASVEGTATAITLEVSTGCRPRSSGVDYAPAPVVPPASEVPAAFLGALKALGAEQKYTVTEATCPSGRTARTFTAEGIKVSGDPGWALGDVAGGEVVIRADPHEWAYRVKEVSLVVTEGDGVARVSATVGCR